MSRWHLHTLNAQNRLTLILTRIRAAGNKAVTMAESCATVPPFDLVVKADSGAGGAAMRSRSASPGLIEVTLDPARWDEAEFIRVLVRALARVMRWDGPGHGATLGERLVSDGLAGHFIVQVLGGDPDPWDQVTPDHGLAGRALREWGNQDFDRGLWYQGKGDLPKWVANGLAYQLVATHLQRNPHASAASLATVPAEVLRITLRAMAVNDEIKPGGRITERTP